MTNKLTAEELGHIKVGVEQAQAGRLVRGFAQAEDILGSFIEVLDHIAALEQEHTEALADARYQGGQAIITENEALFVALEEDYAQKEAEIKGLRKALFAAKDYLESWGPVDGDERYIDASDTLMDVLDIALGEDA